MRPSLAVVSPSYNVPPMRYLLVCLAVFTVVSATGCQERQQMRTVPDREGRAGGDGSQNMGAMANAPVAGPNEHWYTMEAKDDLYTVAKKFNTTTEWLIKRNEIKSPSLLTVGKNLIVPGK